MVEVTEETKNNLSIFFKLDKEHNKKLSNKSLKTTIHQPLC